MESIVKIGTFLKSLCSIKKDSSSSQAVSDTKAENISPINGNGNMSLNHSSGNIVGNHNLQVLIPPPKKKILSVLESWMSDLEKGVYKSHSEIVTFFCRTVIPFLHTNPEAQILVNIWKKEYKTRLAELDSAQKAVLQDCERTFREIIQAVGECPEHVRFKIEEIQKILTGDRSQKGFSSWPLHQEVYSDVKDLLEMLMGMGKHDLCARYTDIKKNVGNEPYISEFTFASDICNPILNIQNFNCNQVQNPPIVWHYFELALHFWNSKPEAIEKELKLLHPFNALYHQRLWEEIVLVKNPKKNHTITSSIFKDSLFINGLRTINNEIIIFFPN